MKKETIIALILGIGTGAVIAMIFLVNTNKITIKEKKLTPTEAPKKIMLPETAKPFVVKEPQNGAVMTKDEVIITGEAPVQSLLLAQSANAETSVKLTKKDFSFTLSLERGQNIIHIVNYDKKLVTEKTLTVYYLPEE